MTLAADELNKRLQRALRIAGDTHTIEDIKSEITAGRFQVFSEGDSFVLTEIIQEPQQKFLNVFLAVGEMSVVKLIPKIEAFAEQTGCSWVQTLGRPGWKSVLPEYDWQPTHVLFKRQIGNDDGWKL